MHRRPGTRRGQRLMDIGRSVRAWAKDDPALAASLIALAQEVERSARSSLLTLAHSQAKPSLGAAHEPELSPRLPGAVG